LADILTLTTFPFQLAFVLQLFPLMARSQAQIAEIRISFDKPTTHIYGPGELVSGKAIFVPNFNSRLRALEVCLRGECYTSSLGSQAKVSHAVPLFDISSELLQTVYTYKAETYEASFQFKFPSKTAMPRSLGPEALSDLFNQNIQLLPDSFVISTRNTLQCVRYFIHVQLHGRSKAVAEATVLFRQSFVTTDTDINFTSSSKQKIETNGPIIPDRGMKLRYMDAPQDSSRQASELLKKEKPVLSLHALPLQSAHQTAWLERARYAKANRQLQTMEWFLKPWKTPRILFMPSIYMPKKIAVGQEMPILLAIDSIRNPMWKSNDFVFRLLGFSIAVTAHTRTIMQNRPSKHMYGRCLELSYSVLEVEGLQSPLTIDGSLTCLVTNFKILPGVIPSFKTYTINRGYSVDIFLRFQFDGDELQWGASMALDITSKESVSAALGTNMDPLLSTNPHKPPEYFWTSRIEAGAAECTGRTDVYPEDPEDPVNLPRTAWDTIHGRLPRASYACASALLASGLDQIQNRKKNKEVRVLAGKCGKPHRKYMRELEPMIAPLSTFKHSLRLDKLKTGA
jgi:hypothetical protein